MKPERVHEIIDTATNAYSDLMKDYSRLFWATKDLLREIDKMEEIPFPADVMVNVRQAIARGFGPTKAQDTFEKL